MFKIFTILAEITQNIGDKKIFKEYKKIKYYETEQKRGRKIL